MAIGRTDGGTIMGEMNTTPLIDVMLVLLVMIIITVPVATHSTDMNLPQPCERDCPTPPLEPIVNKIAIDPQDRILWNGEPVDERQLATLLHQVTLLKVEPQLHFEPAATASYEASLRVLNIVRASGVTNFGFVGNERYRAFDKNR